MAEKIGPQHGIEAARLREKELHPAYSAAWDRRSDTLLKLVQGHNETIGRLADLEGRLSVFPFGGSST